MERQPQTRTSRIPRGLRYPLYSAVAAFAVAAAACSGSEKGATNPPGSNPNGENHVPTATAKLEPTATEVIIPTATEVPFEPQSLFDAPYEPTTIEQVAADIDAAYQAHPDANEFLWVNNSTPFPKENIVSLLDECEHGLPGTQGDSGVALTTRLASCGTLSATLYHFYGESQYDEFYQSAISLYNYMRNSEQSGLPADRLIEAEDFMKTYGVK